jgi:hypothetical protein
MLGFLLPLAASLGASGSSLGGTRSLMKFKPPIPTLNLNASSATGTSPSMTPNCPPGPWHQTGQIDATHPLCGLSNDGVTESSAALAQCLQLAANCSGKTMSKMAIFFPPGAYWLARTVVFSAANGTTGMTLVGSGMQVSWLCKCANCSAAPSNPNFDQCGPSASGLLGPRGPVIQIGTPADEDGFGGIAISDLTIRGVEIGVYIVNAPSVSMSRTQIQAGGYDGGDMDAAMIISESPTILPSVYPPSCCTVKPTATHSLCLELLSVAACI